MSTCPFEKRRPVLRVAASAALTALTYAAFAAEPLPTRRPDGLPPPPPPDYVAPPLDMRPVVLPSDRAARDFEPGLHDGGRVAVIVETALYASVSNSLATYAADLTSHGFAPFAVTFSGSAEQLRTQLAVYYAEPASLAGAVFVGNLPYAVWEMIKSFDAGSSYYAADICDFFFMDLDGTWEDHNDDAPFAAGRYDTRGGDLLCEIWVTRIAADNMSVSGYTTASLLNGYFSRNHAYRSGVTSVAKNALHYTDNDWSDDATYDVRELGAVYASVTSRVCSVHAGTGGADYRDNHLPSNVELIQVRCHGTATTHMWDDGVYVTSSDYLVKDPHAVFYNLYTCSGGDFTTANGLSRTAVMNPEAGGLAAWSHSGTGGMITFDRYRASVFYDALGSGQCLGEAFRLWYNSCVVGDQYVMEPYWKTPKWFNGMRIDGDGCLTLRTPIIRYVSTAGGDAPPYTSWATAARSVHAVFEQCGPGDIVRIAAGRYVLTNSLIFTTSKAITLTGTDPGAAAVLDASQLAVRDRCVYVQSGVRAVLENLTLTGGSSLWGAPNGGGYGGGARLEDGVLRDCVISNSTAGAGGGLYLAGEALVENCTVVSNRATGSGGGFITWDATVIMTDTIVSNNVAVENGGGGITTDGGCFERCRVVANQARMQGGGLYLVDAATRVDGCLIQGNTATQKGGGLYISRGAVLNSLISGNVSGIGGGVYAGEWSATWSGLTNLTVTANSAGTADGVFAGYNVSLLNCIVWGNNGDNLMVTNATTTINHSCLGESYAGTGDNNLFADPLLTSDYRLAEGSPCINRGATPSWMAGTSDLADNPRALPETGAADIGAFEYTGPFGLFASPGALTFSTYETYDPAPQAFAVCSDAVACRFAACVSEAGWLGVSSALAAGASVRDTAPLEGQVTCQVDGLAPGHYTVAVDVRTNGAASAFTVPVTLDVLPLQTDALAFGPVATPQGTGVAFTVRLAARNAAGYTNRNHSADVALEAYATDVALGSSQVGAGTGTTDYFLYTYYHDSRSQMIFLASELGAAGNITNIAFYLTQVPSPAILNTCTLRLKHTSLASYSGASFETAGWQTGYSANRTLSSGQLNTWVNFPINPPFAYGGTSNLLVDFSFNNSSYSTSGKVRYTSTGTSVRHYHGYSDSGAGDPLYWTGISGGPTRSERTLRPNLRFDWVRSTEIVIPTRPAMLAGAAFSQGVWQGCVAIDAVRSNVTLRAQLSSLTALSNPVDILVDAPEGPIPSAWLAQFGLPPDADPDGNPDNDAFTTEQEYVADTNPTNGALFLRVTAVDPGPPATVTFEPASAARHYTLQTTTNLAADVWSDVPGQGPRPGVGGSDQMTDSATAPARFYRVRVALP